MYIYILYIETSAFVGIVLLQNGGDCHVPATFFIPKIVHSSYLLAGARTCAIVDPRRDVQIYLLLLVALGE